MWRELCLKPSLENCYGRPFLSWAWLANDCFLTHQSKQDRDFKFGQNFFTRKAASLTESQKQELAELELEICRTVNFDDFNRFVLPIHNLEVAELDTNWTETLPLDRMLWWILSFWCHEPKSDFGARLRCPTSSPSLVLGQEDYVGIETTKWLVGTFLCQSWQNFDVSIKINRILLEKHCIINYLYSK